MILNLLVATIDAGIGKVENLLLDPRSDVRYIISHQVTDERFRPVPEALKRDDVVVGQIKGRGLSRNRNNALALADGDIALLADDDALYRPRYFETVLDTFSTEKAIDVACFKIATPDGEPEYKEYCSRSYLLNEESHHFISSLEVAFRLETVKEVGLQFDERFGTGSPLVSYGEEAVFIDDCLKSGMRVSYIPYYVVEHPLESAVRRLDEFAEEKVIFKGAYDARRYGWLAVAAAFFDTLRYWRKMNSCLKSPLRYLQQRMRGALYIFRN